MSNATTTPTQTSQHVAHLQDKTQAKRDEIATAVTNIGRLSLTGAGNRPLGIPEIAAWVRDLSVMQASLADAMKAMNEQLERMIERDTTADDDTAEDFVRPLPAGD